LGGLVIAAPFILIFALKENTAQKIVRSYLEVALEATLCEDEKKK
jgi:hypothetical protein